MAQTHYVRVYDPSRTRYDTPATIEKASKDYAFGDQYQAEAFRSVVSLVVDDSTTAPLHDRLGELGYEAISWKNKDVRDNTLNRAHDGGRLTFARTIR
jgi:hypothetical protein